MKRMAALLCAVVLMLTGCGKAEQPGEATIIGQWEQRINAAAALTNVLVDEQVAYFMDLEEAELVLTITFGEDGSYSSVLDENKSKPGFNAFVDAWYEATKELYAALLKQNNSNATVDELLADYKDMHGKSLREALQEQVTSADFPNRFKIEGTYRVEDNKLFRNEKEDVFETFLLENGALYILGSSDTTLSKDDAQGYPYKFERVK